MNTTEHTERDSIWAWLGGLLSLAVFVASMYALFNPGDTIVPVWHSVAHLLGALW